MREIKFRGFHEHEGGETVITINGEKKCGAWVYGVPIKTKIGIFIIDEENPHYCSQYFYMEIQVPKLVIPETVGQFTGLRDKNGTEVYAGDICNCREYECFGKVEWNDDEAGFFFCVVIEGGGFEEERLYEYIEELEIIGNMFGNPELMEENNENNND